MSTMHPAVQETEHEITRYFDDFLRAEKQFIFENSPIADGNLHYCSIMEGSKLKKKRVGYRLWMDGIPRCLTIDFKSNQQDLRMFPYKKDMQLTPEQKEEQRRKSQLLMKKQHTENQEKKRVTRIMEKYTQHLIRRNVRLLLPAESHVYADKKQIVLEPAVLATRQRLPSFTSQMISKRWSMSPAHTQPMGKPAAQVLGLAPAAPHHDRSQHPSVKTKRDHRHKFMHNWNKEGSRVIKTMLPTDFSNALVIPMFNQHGHVQSAQVIVEVTNKETNQKGIGKYFMRHGGKHGLRVVLGEQDISASPAIITCEGYSTGQSIRMLTDFKIPVVVCFDSGNLLEVTKQMRAQWPDLTILNFADNDHQLAKKTNPQTGLLYSNVGVESSHACVEQFNAISIVPPFDETAQGSDFNDFMIERGLEQAKQYVSQALTPYAHLIRPSPSASLSQSFMVADDLVMLPVGSPLAEHKRADTLDYLALHTAFAHLAEPLSIADIIEAAKNPIAHHTIATMIDDLGDRFATFKATAQLLRHQLPPQDDPHRQQVMTNTTKQVVDMLAAVVVRSYHGKSDLIDDSAKLKDVFESLKQEGISLHDRQDIQDASVDAFMRTLIAVGKYDPHLRQSLLKENEAEIKPKVTALRITSSNSSDWNFDL